MKRRAFFLSLSLMSVCWAASEVRGPTRLYDRPSILVCGDHFVYLVDEALSVEEKPHIVWTWDAHQIQDLPEDFRLKKFNSVDDVKPVQGGRQLLISSSSGAVALWDLEQNRTLFYAWVPNAHSVELLPGGLLVAAASLHAEGNQLMLFDLKGKSNTPIFTDALYSAHGVVWHEERQTLFALGHDVLREYRLQGQRLERLAEWKIPGESGHDLTLAPDRKSFFLTEHTGAWRFDLATQQFSKIEGFPDAENIKSLNQAANGRFLYTVPEESWWTRHVSFYPPAKRLAFPHLRTYKARWYRE
jgi:WD40 repeat protein